MRGDASAAPRAVKAFPVELTAPHTKAQLLTKRTWRRAEPALRRAREGTEFRVAEKIGDLGQRKVIQLEIVACQILPSFVEHGLRTMSRRAAPILIEVYAPEFSSALQLLRE